MKASEAKALLAMYPQEVAEIFAKISKAAEAGCTDCIVENIPGVVQTALESTEYGYKVSELTKRIYWGI